VGKRIALLFHDRGTRRGWVVSSTLRPHLTPGKGLVPILQEAGWAPGPVWTGGKSRPHRDSIPDRPARSSVAIPTELHGSLCTYIYIYIYTHTHTHRVAQNWINAPCVIFCNDCILFNGSESLFRCRFERKFQFASLRKLRYSCSLCYTSINDHMAKWLTNRLKDWLIECLTDWSTDRFTDSFCKSWTALTSNTRT